MLFLRQYACLPSVDEDFILPNIGSRHDEMVVDILFLTL
jgi:hypothetical protein